MADPKAIERITEVKRRYEPEIMAKQNVIGFGIGFKERGGISSDELSLVVFVSKKLPAEELPSADRIPLFLDGFPVDVREVGAIEAF